MFYCHVSSFIDKNVKIGEGTKIWHFCHIQEGAEIGKNCIIGQNVHIAPGVKIGNNVKIQNNVSIFKGVEIKDDVFIGPSVVFTNVINPRSFIERKDEFKTTIVSKGASIGANSTIICGNDIGEYAFVGGGSVVTKSVNPYRLVYGCPAEDKARVCKCGGKIVFYKCKICKKVYKEWNE